MEHYCQFLGLESETGDEYESEHLYLDTVDPVPLVVETRYGRYAGNWLCQNYNEQYSRQLMNFSKLNK